MHATTTAAAGRRDRERDRETEGDREGEHEGKPNRKKAKQNDEQSRQQKWLAARKVPAPSPPCPVPAFCQRFDIRSCTSLAAATPPPLPLPLPFHSSLCRPSTHLADAAVSYFFPHFHFIFHFSCTPPPSPPHLPALCQLRCLVRSFAFFFFLPLVSLRSFSHFYFDCKTHFYSPCRA